MKQTLRKVMPAALAVALATTLGMTLATAQATPQPTATVQPHAAAGAATTEPGHPAGGKRCTGTNQKECLLPFPSDWWTRPDSTTATGRRVDITRAAMPRNQAKVPIDPTSVNQRDGFSPGQVILADVPGLDSYAALRNTGAAQVTDMGDYARADQPIVVIDAATGKRWPVWSEVDLTAGSNRSLLMIHPSRNFTEGHRYIVALRNLRTASGALIKPTARFAREVNGTAPRWDVRAAHTAELVHELGARWTDLWDLR